MLYFTVSPSFGELPEGRWVHYERQAPVHAITGIFHGSGGDKFWVSTGYSLNSFDGTHWKKHIHEDQPLSDYTPFFRDEKGRFFYEDNGALLVLDNGVVTRYADVEIRFPVIAASIGDAVYFGLFDITTGGVYAFDGSAVKKIRGGRVRSIAFDAEGTLWATILDPDKPMALWTFKGETWTDRSGEIASILPAKTNDLTVQIAPNGAVWVSNIGKYGVYGNGSWNFKDGGAGPLFLSFDRSGRVWGYRNRTVYRLDESGAWVVSLTMDPGIPNMPFFITEDADGTVWSFNNEAVMYYKNGTWSVLKNNLDLASDRVTCMVYTDDGKLICGHGLRGEPLTERKDDGLSIWDGTGWSNYNMSDDIYLYNVYLLKRSPDGEIYAHTDHGLKVFNGKAWASVDTLRAIDIADIAWDDRGVMWIASYNGLIEYDDPRVDFKVNPKWLYPFKVFYNLNFDSDGVLYMQTNYGGIVSYSEDREEAWVSHPSDTIYVTDIAIDSEGTLWSAQRNALSKWDTYKGWIEVVMLNGGRLVDIDSDGRIWASGYGTTGYFENGAWNPIPTLSHFASDVFIFDGEGRFALNAFEVDDAKDPPERINFAGVFEYLPGMTGIENDRAPQPFITAINYPNPFNPSTTISFTIPGAERVTVAVYSLLGQKVATLASGWYPPGESRVVWDARSDDGYPCASGVYLYRIVAGDAVKTGKMLLVR